MMQDEKIVELYLKRDEAAIRETSEKYGSRLHRLSFSVVGDRTAAEECVNDTYLQAWNSIPPNEPYTYLFQYLARIARHISINMCRKRDALKRKAYVQELSLELEQCIPAPDDCECRLDEKVLSEAINSFLKDTDILKRNVFVRRYYYLDSISSIAKRYGLSESNVKTTLLRLRQKLRVHLEKEGYVL